jgi:hypothetical protein
MRLVEVDYAFFAKRLEDAGNCGERIEPADRERWKEYVKKHDIREGAALVLSRKLCEKVVPVIIDSADSWNGYYLHSRKDVFCVRFDIGR